jgi:BirA family biotin operon repressor/biotin-[acetyl-CoA-carboxylase] ligase
MSRSTRVPAALAAALESNAHRLRPFGIEVVHFTSVGSTNDIAGQLAGTGAPEGTLVIADAQTAGRGRLGRTWFSPPLAGLYASVVLRPAEAGGTATGRALALSTLMAGVAIATAVRSATGVMTTIKWPNDIVVEEQGARRKLAGILAEAASSGGSLQHVVLGYGINLLRVACPAELAGRVTSLEHEGARTLDRVVVLTETLAALAAGYAALAAGRPADLIAAWRALSPSCDGAPVSLANSQDSIEGVTAGVDETGALLVRTPGGRTEAVRASEVTWL